MDEVRVACGLSQMIDDAHLHVGLSHTMLAWPVHGLHECRYVLEHPTDHPWWIHASTLPRVQGVGMPNANQLEQALCTEHNVLLGEGHTYLRGAHVRNTSRWGSPEV